MPINVTITESLQINASPEAVWDFTQDYARRSQWDASVLSAAVLVESPERTVRVRFRGGLTCTLLYRLSDRPKRTSVAMIAVESRLVEGGGGSWAYDAAEGGTRWTQTNTLVLKSGPLSPLLRLIFGYSLARATRKAMREAKERIESAWETSSPPR